MSTFVFVHGGCSSGWDWHLVEQRLRALGHDTVAPDLPTEDPALGLDDYADVVADAAAGRHDPVVVAHSLGGLTAPLVCHRISARLLVMVAAIIPAPGESFADWWSNTGHAEATADNDYSETETYFHDVPEHLAAEAEKRARDQSEPAMRQPWPGADWPRVPTRYLLCRDDRLFPAAWMRDLVRARLGIVPDEMDGGHYIALARPAELALRLDAHVRD